MNDEKLLKEANIPESWWPYCKVENGVIRTPSMQEKYEYGLISQEEYQAYLKRQGNNKEKSITEKITEIQEQISVLNNQLQLLILLEMEG